MPGNLQLNLARMPLIGYLLKVIHDVVRLPVLRADLHRECEGVARRVSTHDARWNENDSHLRRHDDALAAISATLARMEAGLAAVGSRESVIESHFETLLQRVSDNLAEWVDLRRCMLAVEGDAAGRDRELVTRLDEAVAQLGDLQAQMHAQEETFGGVLRRQGRILAALQEAIQRESALPHLEVPAPDLLQQPSRGPRLEVRLSLADGAPAGRTWLRIAPGRAAGGDVVADAGELPFVPSSVSEIYAGGLLESCSAKEGRRLLPYWSGLLRPGGTLHLVVTDSESAGPETIRRLRESGFYSIAEEGIEIRATKAGRQFLPKQSRSVA